MDYEIIVILIEIILFIFSCVSQSSKYGNMAIKRERGLIESAQITEISSYEESKIKKDRRWHWFFCGLFLLAIFGGLIGFVLAKITENNKIYVCYSVKYKNGVIARKCCISGSNFSNYLSSISQMEEQTENDKEALIETPPRVDPFEQKNDKLNFHGIDKDKKIKYFLIFAIIIFVIFAAGNIIDYYKNSQQPQDTQKDEFNPNDIIVRYLTNTTVKYDDEKQVFILSFSLQNVFGEDVVANGKAQIEIKNNNDETLYANTHSIDIQNFYNSTDSLGNKRLVYNITIPLSEIKKSDTKYGALAFRIYNDKFFDFEWNTFILSDLPLRDTTIVMPKLPYVKNDYYTYGKLRSSYEISDVRYEIVGTSLYLYFSGERLDIGYEDSLNYFSMYLKLRDESGAVVETSILYLSSISLGDKFKNKIVIMPNCIDIGGTYTLEFVED